MRKNNRETTKGGKERSNEEGETDQEMETEELSDSEFVPKPSGLWRILTWIHLIWEQSDGSCYNLISGGRNATQQRSHLPLKEKAPHA